MNTLFRKHLADIDLTLSQLSILFLISKKTQLTQQALGEILYLEKSTVTRNLRRLMQGAYLKKNEDHMLEVTHQGKKLIEKAIPKWEAAMKEARQKINTDGEEAIGYLLKKLST